MLFKKSFFVFLSFVLSFLPGVAVNARTPDLSVEEPGCHFFSGSEIKRHLVLTGESLSPETEIQWRTMVGPAVIQAGRERIVPGAHRWEISLRLPEVKRRREMIWQIILVEPGKVIMEKTITLSVFPREIPRNLNAILSRKNVGILETGGEVKAVFDRQEIPCTSLFGARDLDAFSGDLIIVQAVRMPAAFLDDISERLTEKARAGTAVLIIGLSCNLNHFLIPVGSEPRLNSAKPVAKSVAVSHPVFSELSENDLTYLLLADGADSRFLKKPSAGNFRVLLTESGSGGALLLEIPCGRGRIIFCQLDVLGKFGSEPVARILLENLVRYSLQPAAPWRTMALIADPGSKEEQLFRTAGLVFSFNPDSLDEYDLIFLTDGETLRKRLQSSLLTEEIRRLVAGGKIVFISGFSPATFPAIRRMLPVNIGLTGYNPADPVQKSDSHLLWGIEEDELSAVLKKETDSVYCLDFLPRRWAIALFNPPVAGKFLSGKGGIILWAFPLPASDSETGRRIFAQLATNLQIAILPGATRDPLPEVDRDIR